MICPNCQHDYPLTWAAYCRSVLGRHRCRRCRTWLRVVFTMDYLLLFALPVSVLLVVLPVFVSWIYDGREDMVVMVMLAVMVWLPMADRRAQETLLELRPIGH